MHSSEPTDHIDLQANEWGADAEAGGTGPHMAIADVQAVLVEILQHVTAICERRGIEIFLIGGGCLGLARHGGLIPWDDDLDLSIRASDVPAFLEAMHELPPHLLLRSDPSDHDPARGHFPIYKVMDRRTRITGDKAAETDGIFLDVLPMMLWRSRAAREVEHFFHWLSDQAYRGGRYNRLLNRLGAAAVGRWALRLLRPVFSRQDARCRVEGSGIVAGAYGRRWIGKYPHGVVFPLRRTSFCGVEVSVPNDIHRFLALRYGADYMVPPAESARWRHFDSASRVDDS
jgi:lipopolysaccharide cholinephosphotransferase